MRERICTVLNATENGLQVEHLEVNRFIRIPKSRLVDHAKVLCHLVCAAFDVGLEVRQIRVGTAVGMDSPWDAPGVTSVSAQSN